ncbi:MAG: hypothetical protein HY816_20165 [Candidatus Wallbacteria bacterium]|nr:hypothetical protein [Candidatus Wallbacteria bacterium]
MPRRTTQIPRESTSRLPTTAYYAVHDDHIRYGFDVDSAAVTGATTTTIVLPLPLAGPSGVTYRAVLRWGWHVDFEPLVGGRR